MTWFFRFNVFCFMMISLHAELPLTLSRLRLPDQKAVNAQYYQQVFRKVTRYTKGASASIGLGIILYCAYQIHQQAVRQEFESIFLEQEKRLLASDKKRFEGYLQQMRTLAGAQIASNPEIVPNLILETKQEQPGFVGQLFGNLKAFGWSSSKFLADSLLLIVSGSAASYVYDYMKNKINLVFSPESITWYLQEHTKITWIFTDLKTYAVDYDLYASVLSAELFNQDAQVHMQALIKDMHHIVVRNFDDMDMQSSAYWHYLFDELKKKYIKKSSNFENRQDFVDLALLKQHRVAIDQDALFLFVQDMNRRRSIVQFCVYLCSDLQKLIDFIAFKLQTKCVLHEDNFVTELVDISNKFFDHMELLLNASMEELNAFSKQDRGMFTAIYEYEKIFNEQMNFLHRYCKYSA